MKKLGTKSEHFLRILEDGGLDASQQQSAELSPSSPPSFANVEVRAGLQRNSFAKKRAVKAAVEPVKPVPDRSKSQQEKITKGHRAGTAAKT